LRRFQRKIGSWLGLIAILMASLAPTISHTLAARADRDPMSAVLCSAASMGSMDAISSIPDESAHVPAAPDDSPSKHAQMSDGDACGYCSLLAHLPVLPSVEALFLVAVRVTQHTVAVRFDSTRRVEPLTFAQPRAPPSAS